MFGKLVKVIDTAFVVAVVRYRLGRRPADTNSETWTQICVLEGDSGGPVVVGSTLVGMVNAYLAIGCFGPTVGTNMSAIMDDINARGDIGAGFAPI